MNTMKRKTVLLSFLLVIAACGFGIGAPLGRDFLAPPASARPWVYFMVMDGNLTREGITADFEAMQRAGIGGVIFIEVNVNIPRGPVKFMSAPWQDLFAHAVAEADRLGLELALATGPGWCGTGGPWVKPADAMQHLVASETNATGPAPFDGRLPQPQPRTPYFGKATLTPTLAKQWNEFYHDECVIAFPTPEGKARIADIGEKALYFREPYSSKPGVNAFLPAPAEFETLPANECIAPGRILDLTDKLQPDGRLTWDVPPGNWTVMRFGRTLTGQTTRPAPEPGLGFETDKFSREAIDAHFENFLRPLIQRNRGHIHSDRGFTGLHFDSWEMGSQNWTKGFRREFQKRRGYDPLPWLPALAGRVVASEEMSTRFLWDLRQTAQELVIENHLTHLEQMGRHYGLRLSVEPYDLNPCADLELGATADVPQCEFWGQGHGFATEFSAFEAVSIGHTLGRPVIAAESFTSAPGEDWKLFPGAMKSQGDWALCCGVNRFIFHRYQHQPWLDRAPGMTFANYGVHWDRTQTWWDMVPAFHLYLSRCQALLRRGQAVADVLYLTPEGAPMVFRPPASAMTDGLPDRRGYNFDGCAPSVLLHDAKVKNGRITFPGGMSYQLLVLPEFETMTPRLLAKVKDLVAAGATVVGAPPSKSPGLEHFPNCDAEVKKLAAELWGEGQPVAERSLGKGRLIFDAAASQRNPAEKITNQTTNSNGIYPDYSITAEILSQLGVPPDFTTDGDVRYIHRHEADAEIYFVASRTNAAQTARCQFRVTGKEPELWNPATGEQRVLPDFTELNRLTTVPLEFAANESFFLIFRKSAGPAARHQNNFTPAENCLALTAPWTVSFDPKWGGPTNVTFAKLEDWSQSTVPGIRFYSGKAVYRTQFSFDRSTTLGEKFFLSLGEINGMAAVKLNGKDLGVAWCPPWRVAVPREIITAKSNHLEITVANLWPNRLIGDLNLPPEQRLAWTTINPFKKDSPLLPSGLRGAVALLSVPVPADEGDQRTVPREGKIRQTEE